MLRLLNALFLSFTLALTSYGLAVARGQSPDIGMEMVICSGVGMTTITIGADGEPVKTTHICPDGMSIFAAAFTVSVILTRPAVMQWRVIPSANAAMLAQETLSPSARGPPLVV